MGIEISPARADEEPTLAALLQLYAYDLSDVLAMDPRDDGRFAVPSLAAYWSDPRREPYLIRVDGALAGFALVERRSRLTGDESVTDMAEFFVARRHRRRGVGEHAATWLFDRHPGPWEVRERAQNRGAIAFWRRVIDRYTGGRFDEEVLADERWHGPVQRFDNGRY